MEGYICALIYLCILEFVYASVKNKYIMSASNSFGNNKFDDTRKISVTGMLVVSIVFAAFNWYCTSRSVGYGSDRLNYLTDFNGIRKTSIGLEFVFKLYKHFSGNFLLLLYIITFFCCFIALLSYRHCVDASYYTILFLLSTNFIVFTFTALKQSFSIVLSYAVFVIMEQKKCAARDVCALILSIIACLFHSTGFILFPILIYFWISEKTSKYTRLIILILLFSALFFEQICLVVARLVPIGRLSAKIYEYFGNKATHGQEGTGLIILKGFPYYILAIWGALYRKLINKRKRKMYDRNLILTVMGVVFFLASAHSYWMARFTALFYFPMGVLFNMLMQQTSRNNRKIFSTTIIVSALLLTLRSMILVYINFGGY